ncbi:interleukin-8-like [Melanotaenia boesemani]|uniref:interleukin-8-like n=1 Tax=Melanotaenia boesemani TaxID=1250792 RepID=UPI001C03BA4F|nr:interleukin-8-like [Melanotaenia boesemani]
MNPAIQCIFLLACVAICFSASIKFCSCIKTSKGVKPSLIVEVIEYKPRPYCNKQEVIVKLKNSSLWCLDPNSNFTKEILQRAEMNKAAKMPTSIQTTTVATSTSAPTSP